jgi:hypothetical protein
MTLIGTIALSCAGVSGCASGSPLAAAVMFLSSSTVGTLTLGRLRAFDISFHLSSIRTPKADDPSCAIALYKCNVVQNFGQRHESDHSRFVVDESTVHPDKRRFPVEVSRSRQRHAVFDLIRSVFVGIEFNLQLLL